MKPGKHGVARVVAATFYSFKGLQSCLKNEAAFRQEAVLFLLSLPVLFFLKVSLPIKLLLVAVGLLVLVVELLNSAIESIVDLTSPDYNELAGRAKDMGSAAVLLTLLIAGLCWCYAFYLTFSGG